jgi:hypothetical protein
MQAIAVRWQCPLHDGDDTNCPHHMGTSTGADRFNRMPTPPVHIAGGAAARVATQMLRAVDGARTDRPSPWHDSLLTTQLFGNDWRSTADLRPPPFGTIPKVPNAWTGPRRGEEVG